ncbi:MAG: M14 family zinc carboxypeptidase [Bdellovibrionota bacterium]
MTYFKITKIVFFLSILLQLKSHGQLLEENSNQKDLNNFVQISEKVLPILGMPVNLFQIFQEERENKILKNIVDVCARVDYVYKKLVWGESPCLSLPWKYDYVSELGKPLLYWEYSSGNVADDFEKKNTTVILGGVHADEVTPIHMAFKVAKTLHDNPETYRDVRVIIAPLVNPDGFFAHPFKRTNANGVDLNRNFPTRTWDSYATKEWLNARVKDKRKFPGYYANSEQGTRFQTDLIEKFRPDRIISIHAPLAFLDLDFDYKRLFNKNSKLSEEQKKAKEVARIISRNAGNYRIIDLGSYPGSLGNYAGNERTIPTITLELSSSDSKKVYKFWDDFSPGIFKALKYEFRPNQVADLKSFIQ